MAQPRQFSWGLSALVSGVINFAINAPIGWFMVHAGSSLRVWGLPGVAPDIVITAYAIAFGTALVVTPQTQRQVERGQLLPPVLSQGWRRAFAGWPRSRLRRAINLGVLSVLLFAPLPLLVLWLSGVPELDRTAVTALKGGFSFVEGALVTPVIMAAATVAPE
jgi:hypothetical protein